MAIVKNDPNAAAPQSSRVSRRFWREGGDSGWRRVRGANARAMARTGPGDRKEPTLVPARDAEGPSRGEGRIGSRAVPSGDEQSHLVFEIESRRRVAATRLSNLLYHHLRTPKEVQLRMLDFVLEGVVDLSGGHMTGGVDIET